MKSISISPETLKTFVQELAEFAGVPNNVQDVQQIRENAIHIKSLLERRKIYTELIETPTGRPLVYGEFICPDAQKTILIYSHYDGVPVEMDSWHSDPYKPVASTFLPEKGVDCEFLKPEDIEANDLPQYRLFARSVADSKNSIIACLTALDLVQQSGMKPTVNIKFLFDGEEEVESPSLKQCLDEHRDKFKADLVLSASGETHQSGLPTVELGFRGILQVKIEVVTGILDLHSGHFGNFLPNAAFELSSLLSSMKNKDGTVAINQFYEKSFPLSAKEKEMLGLIPAVDEELKTKFGIKETDVKGRSIQELINMPTLNIRGLSAGYVGDEASNIIPSTALAEVDVRLVKGMDPDEIFKILKSHIEGEGFTIMEDRPNAKELKRYGKIAIVKKLSGFPATRASSDSSGANYVIRSVKSLFNNEIVIMPTEGGSLPLYLFEQFGVPIIGLPCSNFDCNQHTHNENLRIDYFLRAIKLFASLYTTKFTGC